MHNGDNFNRGEKASLLIKAGGLQRFHKEWVLLLLFIYRQGSRSRIVQQIIIKSSNVCQVVTFFFDRDLFDRRRKHLRFIVLHGVRDCSRRQGHFHYSANQAADAVGRIALWKYGRKVGDMMLRVFFSIHTSSCRTCSHCHIYEHFIVV